MSSIRYRHFTATLPHNQVKARRNHLIKAALIVFAIGAAYAVFIKITGFGIPCPINHFTGLKCPGCGVTRMCMHIISLDFRSAFYDNTAIFCMLPLIVFIFARFAYKYVKTGSKRDKAAETAGIIAIVVLIIFGILRNII